jgi:multiple sugar transport system substrate-binding protein
VNTRVRVGAAALALTTVLGLVAGCGGKTNSGTSNSGTSNGVTSNTKESVDQALKSDWKGTITLWDGPRWDSGDGNKFFYVEDRVKKFAAANPGVKVDLVQVPWADMPTKLTTAIAGGAFPDIAPVDISGGGVTLSQVEQGILTPLDKYVTKEELDAYFPAAKDAYSHNGKLYGLPTSMTVHSLLLNLDLFKQAKVEPPKDGKWTWDEFQTKLKALSTKLGDKQVYGFSTYIQKGYFEFWPFLLMDGGQLLKDGKFNMDSPEIVGALKKMQDLKLVDKVTSPEYGIANTGDVWKAFAHPDKRYVAVEPWATWAIASLQGKTPYHMDNFMIAEYPTGKSGKPVTISGVGGLVVFKQKDAAKEAMVAKLGKFLSNDEVQVDFVKNYATMPATKSAAAQNPFGDNAVMKFANQMLDQAVTLPTQVNGWNKVEPLVQAQLQLVIAGEKSPQAAMQAVKQDADPLLTKK